LLDPGNAFTRGSSGASEELRRTEEPPVAHRFVLLERFVAIACLALVAVSPCSAQTPDPADRARLATALRHELDTYLKERGPKEHLSALSLAVSFAPGRPALDVTSGTVRYGSGPLVTPSDLYQIGSNTKAFTAVAILRLEARGKLSIDAPIGTYLPQYPAYAKVTLRQMLRMNAGLPSYDNTTAWERMMAEHPQANIPADTLVRLVYPKLESKPGTKYSYSNTGYVLAEQIVASLSPSKSFEVEMAHLIRSAGLKNTFYSSHLYPTAVADRVVAGYYENDDPGLKSFIGKDVAGYSLSWARGAGSIVSTPEDLTIWAREIYASTKLLPQKQKTELESLISTKTAKPLANATPDDPAGFGLGVAQRYAPPLGTFWFYQGETLGFRAAHLYFPNSKLVVAVFANSRPTEKESHLPQLFAKLYATIEGDAAPASPAP
jgi:D-alanyl-D-alanine carboxypeptidase